MTPTRFLLLAILMVLAAAANAGGIDMNDPRRALGREDDVRIDAQLVRDTISAGSPIGVTYQIQNLTDAPVAIADRVSDASYDVDTRTITVGIGSEVPVDGNMPHMITIAPGEKKLFRTAATPILSASAARSVAMDVPRFVQIKVTILRDLAPFSDLLARQQKSSSPQPLPDALFDQWFESSDTIFLNTLPVGWTGNKPADGVDVERRGMRGRTRMY
jgi:hypothetical protein